MHLGLIPGQPIQLQQLGQPNPARRAISGIKKHATIASTDTAAVGGITALDTTATAATAAGAAAEVKELCCSMRNLGVNHRGDVCTPADTMQKSYVLGGEGGDTELFCEKL